MCLGIPAKVATIEPENGILMGKVDFGGIARRICLELVPKASVGDYVIVHAGFAISLLDPEEAQKTFDLIGELERAEWEAASLPDPERPQNIASPSLLPRRREGLGREVPETVETSTTGSQPQLTEPQDLSGGARTSSSA